MAIVRGIASLLIEEHLRRPFHGRVLQLGRQEMMFSPGDLLRICRRHGFVPINRARLETLHASRQPLDDNDFFGMFSLEEVAVTDYVAAPDTSFVHDMNRLGVPEKHEGRYDLIVDGGTMEHVFHVPNFLANVHELLRLDGRIVHLSPASNAVEHGYYSFSPSLFIEYYTANGYAVERCELLDLGSRLRPIRITAHDFLPPVDRSLVDACLSANVHHVIAIASRVAGATAGRAPQHGFYESIWKHAARTQKPSRRLAGLYHAIFASRPSLDQRLRRMLLPAIRLAKLRQSRSNLRAKSRRIVNG